MSFTLLSGDSHHPVSQAIARRFGIRPHPTGTPFGSADGPLVVLHTAAAQAPHCDPGSRPVLVIAPWHLNLPELPIGAALLRHGLLISDLGQHDEAIALQRLLLWPYGDEPVAWLADRDLLAAIEAWLRDPWQGERWLEGPEAFTAEQTAAAISTALQAALSSADGFAALKFQAGDRDGDQLLDPEELRTTLLQAGVSVSEADWALELLGTTTGVDISQFHAGLDQALELALAEQHANVQLVRLQAPANSSELLQHGWSDAAVTSFQQHSGRANRADGITLCTGDTPLEVVLRERAVNWIPVDMVPALGVISRRAGRIEGHNALLFTYRRRDGRVNLLERSLDFRLFDLRDQDVQTSGEVVSWSQGELERSLTLVDQRVVALRVRGHWSDPHLDACAVPPQR